MPKAFLSHSSKDKGYVEIVARKLGQSRIIYDSLTFEEAMPTAEEIDTGMNQSDIFVIFISESALESPWVRVELNKARTMFESKEILSIVPIIIDQTLTHNDERIPEWLKDRYNIQHISQPSVSTRRIQQRLREVSWSFHPRLREREKIFVGRNDLIDLLEQRLDSIDNQCPASLIATGLPSIGRKALLKQCLRKSNVVRESYQPSLIALDSHESLEDFIYKINDLGYAQGIDVKNLMEKSVEDKIALAVELSKQVSKAREIVLIDDNRCLVTPERELVPWFDRVLFKLQGINQVIYAVSSSNRLNSASVRRKEYVFHVEVPELEVSEREGLLKRYSEFENLSLARDDLRFFAGLQRGFPEQVFYTVDFIKDKGVENAKSESYQLIEFNSEKATRLLTRYEHDELAMKYLALLCDFDFISFELLSDIAGDDMRLNDYVQEFFSIAICEFLGADREYFRVNDSIRDFILRNRIPLAQKYKDRIQQHIREYAKSHDDTDASDYFYSVKQALKSGVDIEPSILIPSHFVKTMKELYERHQRYETVIRLGYRVLQNNAYMDDRIKKEIRYFLCLSLARVRDPNFLKEVQEIDGADHNFLLGFYYRLTGNSRLALERMLGALATRPNFPRAKRELVQIYLYTEEYEKALALAEQNYENDKSNPYHIQAYFRCLTKIGNEHEAVIQELLANLRKIPLDKAREMSATAAAEYYAYIGDKDEALRLVDNAIVEFPDVLYPKLTKFEICERFNLMPELKEALDQLEREVKGKSYHKNTALRCKVIYLGKEGKVDEALQLVQSMGSYPENARDKLAQKIMRFQTTTGKGSGSSV